MPHSMLIYLEVNPLETITYGPEREVDTEIFLLKWLHLLQITWCKTVKYATAWFARDLFNTVKGARSYVPH